ncbi:MAG: endonuclease/exonuclease/phosphatase family protein [Prevotella sp.]|nr:endonuclease/exonuclease/phosphatase family protein [Prevotella sp.]
MKKFISHHMKVALLLACATFTTVNAQNSNNQPPIEEETVDFSLLTLNVDGLPGKIFVFNVNVDGPLSEGSERISEYLASKDCDFLCLQEDFNYRWEIWSRLFAGYDHDDWSGGIILEEKEIDFAHLQYLKFECDGLNAVWKKNITPLRHERVAWEKSFGKFSHDFDDIITKGFRRHEMILPDGKEIVVYNLHMDASSERDETKGNDAKDREARQAQWVQLREHILDNLDERPIVVAGDMNSFYHRDDINTVFINAIEETGRAMVKDAWVESCNKGIYPDVGSEAVESETLDNILYISPKGGYGLKLLDFEIDEDGYKRDGKPLGDHYPLIAKFHIFDNSSSSQESKPSGISNVTDGSQSPADAYDLKGVRHTGDLQHGTYIINGKKVVK